MFKLIFAIGLLLSAASGFAQTQPEFTEFCVVPWFENGQAEPGFNCGPALFLNGLYGASFQTRGPGPNTRVPGVIQVGQFPTQLVLDNNRVQFVTTGAPFQGGPAVLSGVATPLDALDAVNKSYVDAGLQGLQSALTNQLQKTRQIQAAGVASALALQQPLPALAPGENGVALGVGSFDRQQALGLQLARGFAGPGNSSGLVSIGFSMAKTSATRAGVSLKF